MKANYTRPCARYDTSYSLCVYESIPTRCQHHNYCLLTLSKI